MIDVNVSLGPWPFRRFPGDTPSDLVARLKRRGVTQAWAGSFEGVFHRDTSAANARLAKTQYCSLYGFGHVHGGHKTLRGLTLTGSELVIAHFTFHSTRIRAISSGGDALLEDLVKDHLIEDFLLPRGE